MIQDLLLKYLFGTFLMGHMTYGTSGKGLYLDGPTFLVLFELGIIAAAFVGSFIWLYKDAVARGKNPFISMILVLLVGWPLSFVWWFWLRPPLKDQNPVAKSGYALPTVSPSTI